MATLGHRFGTKLWYDPETDCIEWMAAIRPDGYGHFQNRGRNWLAHRMAYEIGVGPIPKGLTIDHLCRNRGCQNPEHLEPVTNRENLRRGEGFGAVNSRKTVCDNGHAFTPENTYIVLKGGVPAARYCKACNRARARKYAARKRGDL